MKTIIMKEYATIISEESLGQKIYESLNKIIDEGDSLKVDMEGVKTMATFCAKQIFGQLCKKMGENVFFERVTIVGATEQIKTSIRLGILYALRDE